MPCYRIDWSFLCGITQDMKSWLRRVRFFVQQGRWWFEYITFALQWGTDNKDNPLPMGESAWGAINQIKRTMCLFLRPQKVSVATGQNAKCKMQNDHQSNGCITHTSVWNQRSHADICCTIQSTAPEIFLLGFRPQTTEKSFCTYDALQ